MRRSIYLISIDHHHPTPTPNNPPPNTKTQQTLPVYMAFLLFELTVGMFYPSYGSIKSQSIPEEVRSGVMNIFRIPLNGTRQVEVDYFG